MNIITVNHTTIDGTEALDVVLADEAIEIEKENKALFENNKELYAAGLAMKVENKKLRAALKVIADFDCDCFEDDSCAVCLARLALKETT